MNMPSVVRKDARWIFTALAASAGLAPSLLAQTQPESKPPTQATPAESTQPDRPAQDPSLTSPGSEESMLDSQKRPATPPPIKPTRERPGQRSVPSVPQPSSNIPGLRAFDYNVPGGKFYPEGTFLLTRRGVVVQSDTGEFVFVPAKEGEATKPGSGTNAALAQTPLVLLPTQRLGQLITKVTSPADAVAVSVSGQVFAYRERQYLLLSMFTFDSGASPTDLSPPVKNAIDKPSRPRASAQTSTDDLMAELEKRRGTDRAMGVAPASPPPTNSSSPTPPPAETLEAVKSFRAVERAAGSVRPEGTVLTGKRGRIVRSGADRSIAMAIDNDPDSPASSPMPMLPCRLLETMEALVGQRGDSLTVRFSGRVTVFQGKNYLLPTMYQVVRPGDVAPMQ